jgi:hypothetical protein
VSVIHLSLHRCWEYTDKTGYTVLPIWIFWSKDWERDSQTITSVKEAGSATINDGAWRPFPLEGGWERCHRDTTTTEKGERARPGIKRQGWEIKLDKGTMGNNPKGSRVKMTSESWTVGSNGRRRIDGQKVATCGCTIQAMPHLLCCRSSSQA